MSRGGLTESIKERFRRAGLRRPIIPTVVALTRRWTQRRLPSRYPRYGASELHRALERVGVRSGATVFVHSAWDEFYNFEGTPLDLVQLLGERVGAAGTIAMPAYPLRSGPDEVFDVRRAVTGAGLVAEIFRRTPGARRSTNAVHSVAAHGPAADFLVRDHQHSETPWDARSPYARLVETDAVVVCMGLPRSFGYGTVQHCPESLLYHEIPYFRLVFGEPVTYRHRDEAGAEGTHRIRRRTGRFSVERVRRYIEPSRVPVTQVSNLRIQAVEARYLVDRLVLLARRGITTYYWPLPYGRLFRPAAAPLAPRA